MDLYGIVTEVDSPSKGWYKVSISIWPSDSIVTGVSIRNVILSIGERVNVVQCLFVGSGDEYGFFKADDEYGVVEIPIGSEEAVRNLAPNNFLLNYIAHKAGNQFCMYGTATKRDYAASSVVKIAARVALV